ncbi:FG-GAP repeat protein [Streptomyces sp. YIM 130001]|uniref:FG-GAP-like repeat-containing protein n=1 Tax=Streptomyces sp. YIM 130001 TaxID=2259644 RepID=UPI000E651807|nr:FG-GAP-like repeat-containing protein [Streptomyces sp. YIM 130001]RII20218.1 FG-GAP repeat protein [Streptomyces sp. YIM 130001]
MKSRNVLSALTALAALAALALVTGCGDGGSGASPEPSGEDRAPASIPGVPGESRQPPAGKRSKDPDDVNGDGYRDLLVPAFTSADPDAEDREDRIAVVFGSAEGLDPVTRTVYGRSDLGLPAPQDDAYGKESIGADDVDLADLDGDGFPDFVSSVSGDVPGGGERDRGELHVSWGGPQGPSRDSRTTELQLPSKLGEFGVESAERGDFDGDGHHDLAALGHDETSSLVVMYGPFTRAGAPARSDHRPWADATPIADDIDPSGKHRATSLLLEGGNDGEQSGNTLYPASTGGGLASKSKELRVGSAHAFGDFDGDGTRDIAVGDDGGRNDEPGTESEESDVDGSLAVYPGAGGDPVRHLLPKVPKGAATGYGPGGYVAADPDGDGRDGVLVATYEGATLIDGDRRTVVRRDVPARVDGDKIPKAGRHARPAAAADFDKDGKDELVMHWSGDGLFGLYGEEPTHWWITEGTTARDATSFATTEFATGS